MLLCERVGKRLTYSKLANILNLDAETVSTYISYFEEAFLIFPVNRYSSSLNEMIKSPKKIYLADNGIRNVFVGFKDKGALWENLVFLNLMNLGKIKPGISYYSDDEKEIDFIVELMPNKKIIAIETKYQEKLDPQELEFLRNSRFPEKMVLQNLEDLEKLKRRITK